MPTHDYVIDNQSAPSFRSDLNNALNAIVTQNSNPTAPATTYANMLWYDTANNQIKKRNEANSAWIILGTIDEGTGKFTPNSAITVSEIAASTLVTASETIGSNNNDTTIPTSAAVKAYTDAAVAGVPTSSIDFLGTFTTSSGTASTLSSLTLTSYKFIKVTWDGVSMNVGSSSTGNLLFASAILDTKTLGVTSPQSYAYRGLLSIDLANGVGNVLLSVNQAASPSSATSTALTLRTGLSTATTSISISLTGSGTFSFNGGSARLYGVR